jgi:predicted methyltransferase
VHGKRGQAGEQDKGEALHDVYRWEGARSLPPNWRRNKAKGGHGAGDCLPIGTTGGRFSAHNRPRFTPTKESVMRTVSLAVLIALALPAVAFAQATSKADTAAIAAAVKDPGRQADTAADSRRKVADVMAFAEVKPGEKVLELVPGTGYFTRVFSVAVGPKGHVYAVWPKEYDDSESSTKFAALVKDPRYANVTLLPQPAAQLTSPAKVDLVFTAQNYHDYPDKFMGKVDPAVLNKQVFDALRPGGLYVVIDHAAAAGSGMRDTDTLHRIDPAIVKQQVVAAGFVFDGESDVLRNPADTHDIKVFDPKIRGKTDQFIYRFRKPG